MSEVSLQELRTLRARTGQILPYIGKDLLKFLNADGLTFVRTPTSPRNSDEVNVTTTCSCLMALALTGQMAAIYSDSAKIEQAFRKLVGAPWMSSGLTENNPFTTTLVIRTVGFLIGELHLPTEIVSEADLKGWEIGLGIEPDNIDELVQKLTSQETETMDLIWRSLSDRARAELNSWKVGEKDRSKQTKLIRLITLEIQRVIEGSWIYSKDRFPSLSVELQEQRDKIKYAYQRAAFNRRLLTSAEPIFRLHSRSLADIAQTISRDIQNFTINEYPPSAALIYWFLDGIARAEIQLDAIGWTQLCSWAADEFYHQHSLFVAQQEAMMDPVAMAMAACLCARLRRDARRLGAGKENLEPLPSKVELERSIIGLFSKQTNGIWPKYFPLFHYQEAGSNFCFTFELLEAVLVEFGEQESSLLDDPEIIHKLSKSVDWCERNLLRFAGNGDAHTGWNSGGSLETLQKNQPESWATAVVHMFLWELNETLSAKIQQRLLDQYRALPGASLRSFGEMVDVQIPLQTPPTTIKAICNNMLKELPRGQTAGRVLRRHPLRSAHSALLFGPPGTSKTDLAKAVARQLDWHLIQIDPSDFLRANLTQIYVEAEKIFEDLFDLSGVVVLFDEMDALVQTRGPGTKLDTSAQFLTTFMLPKLARLHDEGRVIFFMATNFQDRFDEAIKRRGRFDVLLCMGPPTLSAKLDNFYRFVGENTATDKTKEAATWFSKLAAATPLTEGQLELYTFAEFKGFVKRLGENIEAILVKLKKMDAGELSKMVDEDSRTATLRLRDLQEPSISYDKISAKKIQSLRIDRKKLEKKQIVPNQITRYVMDWSESRIPEDLK